MEETKIMKKEKASSYIGFKISPAKKEKYEKRAIEENRSLSNFIQTVLDQYLEKVEEAKQLLNQK